LTSPENTSPARIDGNRPLQAQILSGGNAAFLTQRVEDNAFHRSPRENL